MSRIARALDLANGFLGSPWEPVPPDGRERKKRFAIGDCQAPFEQLAKILDAHRLLSDEGRLDPEVALVSVGDHFDFSGGTPAAVGDEGRKILRWFAAHPPDQVVILAGNHDL